MASYYKTIKGKKYDKALLDLADDLTGSHGDGRLSQKDGQALFKKVKDGGTYTEIEKRTIAYIRDKYTFTESGNKWFRTEIKKWAAQKKTAPAKKTTKPATGKAAAKKAVKKTPKTTTKKKTAKKTTVKKSVTKPKPKEKIPEKQYELYDSNRELAGLIEPEPVSKQPEHSPSRITGKLVLFLVVVLIVIAGYFYYIKDKKQIAVNNETNKTIDDNKETQIQEPEKDDTARKQEAEKTRKEESDPQIKEIENISVYFAKGLGWISHQERPKLQPLITYLKENSDTTLVITGYSCDLGNDRINKGLAVYRAKKAAQYLIKSGIQEQRITVKGTIHNNPGENETEEERQKNRRVEFDIQ